MAKTDEAFDLLPSLQCGEGPGVGFLLSLAWRNLAKRRGVAMMRFSRIGLP